MNIGERISVLRKEYLHISQAELAKALGLTQSAIGAYEKEIRNVTEPSIISICREYGVSERWLRYGEGDPFISGSVCPGVLSDLASEYDLDLMDQNLIAEYLKLDKQSRNVLKEYIRNVFLASDEDLAIEKEVAEYRQELIAEKGEKSSASEDGAEKEKGSEAV